MSVLTTQEKKELAKKFYDVDVVNFGDFHLRGGMYTPIYFDLRLTVSYTTLLEEIARLLHRVVQAADVKYDLICGVPYAALPLSTCVAIHNKVPMVMTRKEAKEYGMKNLVEGRYKSGQHCLIIEDVVVSGQSIIETAEILRKVGIKVTDAAYILDREQGGKQILAEAGINAHCAITMTDVVTAIREDGKIDDSTVEKVKKFLAENNCHEIAKKKAQNY